MGRKKDTSWAGRRAVVNLGMSIAELRRRNAMEDAEAEGSDEEGGSPHASDTKLGTGTIIHMHFRITRIRQY